MVAGGNGLSDGPAGPPAAAGASPKHAAAAAAAAAQEAAVPTPGTPGSGGGANYALLDCSLVRCLRLESAALAACRGVLQATVELGTILLWFYVADRTPAVAAGQKVRRRRVGSLYGASETGSWAGALGAQRAATAQPCLPGCRPHPPQTYSRDQILFIFLILTIVAFSYTQRPARAAVAVNRQQTEEWKGWMQVRERGRVGHRREQQGCSKAQQAEQPAWSGSSGSGRGGGSLQAASRRGPPLAAQRSPRRSFWSADTADTRARGTGQ